MFRYFLPNQHEKSIFAITPEQLKQRGIKGIITDLDNTLVEWDREFATHEVIEWFALMKQHGLLVTIISNNNEKRVKSFSDPLGIPFIFQARKPFRKAFKKALQTMKLSKKEVVVIGDQLMTDVFGGNLYGLHTILVIPVASTDGLWTKINRFMERRILNWMRHKGMIDWQ